MYGIVIDKDVYLQNIYVAGFVFNMEIVYWIVYRLSYCSRRNRYRQVQGVSFILIGIQNVYRYVQGVSFIVVEIVILEYVWTGSFR